MKRIQKHMVDLNKYLLSSILLSPHNRWEKHLEIKMDELYQ